MDPVKEERQARRAEERAQWYIVPALLQNVPFAPVWNSGSGKGKRRQFYMTSTHVSQTLEDAILDLHRRQLTEQPQSTTQEHWAQSTRVEVEQQRQIEMV